METVCQFPQNNLLFFIQIVLNLQINMGRMDHKIESLRYGVSLNLFVFKFLTTASSLQ